jgi:single-strand DNA-binding protein
MNSETFVGNLVFPAVRRSPEGADTTRTSFRLAVSEKSSKGKEKTHFLDFVAFGTFADNLLTVEKGTRLVIFARIDSYTKEVQIDGKDTNVTIVSFIAYDGGPSLLWTTAKVTKNGYKPNGGAEVPDKEAAPVTVKPERERTIVDTPAATRLLQEQESGDSDPASRPGRTRRAAPQDSDDEPRERTRRIRDDSSEEGEGRPRRASRQRTDSE